MLRRTSPSHRPRNAEAVIAANLGRRFSITFSRTDLPRNLVVRAATVGTFRRGYDVELFLFIFDDFVPFRLGILLVRVLAPAPNIPVHVEQSQVVRLLEPHR